MEGGLVGDGFLDGDIILEGGDVSAIEIMVVILTHKRGALALVGRHQQIIQAGDPIGFVALVFFFRKAVFSCPSAFDECCRQGLGLHAVPCFAGDAESFLGARHAVVVIID